MDVAEAKPNGAKSDAENESAADEEVVPERTHEDDLTEVNEEVERKWCRRLSWIAALLGVVFLIIAGFLAWRFDEGARVDRAAARDLARDKAAQLLQFLHQRRTGVELLARRLATSENEPTAAGLREVIALSPEIISLRILPTAQDERPLEVVRTPGDAEHSKVVEKRDVDLDAATLADGWNEPVYDNERLVTTVRYVCRGSSRLVAINVSLYGVRNKMVAMGLGDGGHAFMLSGQNSVVVHPVREYVRKGLFLSNFFDAIPGIAAAVDVRPPAGECALVHLTHDGSSIRRALWVFGLAMEGWRLFVIFPESGGAARVREGKFAEWTTVAAIFSLVGFVACGFLASFKGNVWHLWRGVALCSLLLAMCIGLVWRLILLGAIADPVATNVRFTDRSMVAEFSNRYSALSRNANLPKPLFVPTGVFVQSLEFMNANNVSIRGYVWQKYDRVGHLGVRRGLVFPEGTNIQMKDAFTISYPD
ncbi:MAG: hypothetical protein FJX76_03615 [Armatimonadetes bacterium]|nr:hypothetical protein [Armatimonadota bacterium]